MASPYSTDTHMTIESSRKFYGVPDHIPDEQVDKYIQMRMEKDIVEYLERSFGEEREFQRREHGNILSKSV